MKITPIKKDNFSLLISEYLFGDVRITAFISALECDLNTRSCIYISSNVRGPNNYLPPILSNQISNCI